MSNRGYGASLEEMVKESRLAGKIVWSHSGISRFGENVDAYGYVS
jgi:hypothetical protein